MEANPLVYDENTPIPLGKYKFTKLRDIPIDYLRNLIKSLPLGSDLRAYLERNIDKLEVIQNNKINGVPYEARFCQKFTYVDEKAAKKKITQIRSMNIKGRSKPIRTYYCEVCGGWHLTKTRKIT